MIPITYDPTNMAIAIISVITFIFIGLGKYLDRKFNKMSDDCNLNRGGLKKEQESIASEIKYCSDTIKQLKSASFNGQESFLDNLLHLYDFIPLTLHGNNDVMNEQRRLLFYQEKRQIEENIRLKNINSELQEEQARALLFFSGKDKLSEAVKKDISNAIAQNKIHRKNISIAKDILKRNEKTNEFT